MTSTISDFFDRMAENRNCEIAGNLIVAYEQEKRSAGVISFLDPKANELILDVGCGNARDLVSVMINGARVIGVDISPKMIEEARRILESHALTGYELRVANATNLPFPEAHFDKVIASEVIEHIPDWKKSLFEMHRVLKSKGVLVISTPNRRSWYGFDRYVIFEKILRKPWDHPHDDWKTYPELEQALKECGYVIGAKRGICYIPGFIFSYFVLPRFLKKALLFFVRRIEDRMSTLFSVNGYLICIKAIKK